MWLLQKMCSKVGGVFKEEARGCLSVHKVARMLFMVELSESDSRRTPGVESESESGVPFFG